MSPQAVKYLLVVQNMDRAIAFYRDVMGFSEGFLSPRWSEVRFGDAILGLHDGGRGVPQITGLSIQYGDIHEAYEAALAGGAGSLLPPHRREGEPILLARISDPEGNEVMLTQFIGFD